MNKLSMRYDEKRFSKAQNEAIEKAFDTAVEAHEGQFRQSGEPYVIHPIAVAEIVAEWGMDYESIQAALLHDVVEDTDMTVEELAEQFGEKVAELVNGVTKLRLSASPRPAADSVRREASNENLRKLLLASAKDVRVIMVKLADRLHNLRTLGHLNEERRQRIARESLEIFAPLTDRLGMGLLKAEMEDLGFKYALPDEYAELERRVNDIIRKSSKYIESLKRAIHTFVGEAGIRQVTIEGRQKHLYSIYKKLSKVDGDLEKIYDLIAVRIIVPTEADCYQVLGLIHQNYKPLIYRIKDYIAVPKPNGYRSLHTTVFALEGRITEIQIRTPEMHQEAERGLAAHFFYDSQKTSAAYKRGEGVATVPEHLRWVSQLANLRQTVGDGSEFLESARLELFVDRIFVFSPKGDLYELPEGATALDFAFSVHSDIGLKTMGARVNGRMVTLDTKLENRDVVEILTRREPMPNRDWLNFVRTSVAKNRVRSWFRGASRETNMASGRAALEVELRAWGKGRLEELPQRQLAEALDTLHLKSADDMLVAIGEGSLAVGTVLRRLWPDAARPASVPVVKRQESTGKVIFAGDQLPYTLAPCCRPVFPQPLVGYVTRGAGVTVHALGCRNLPNDAERYIQCRWETLVDEDRLVCNLEVTAINRIGLLSDVTGAVAAKRLNIDGLSTEPTAGSKETCVRFVVEVPDLFMLADVMRRLEELPAVKTVRRV